MADPVHRHAAQAALVSQLAKARALHTEHAANPVLAAAMQRLAEWQSRRLAQTYADLASQSRYAEAIAFFRSDLYGADTIARRDADLAQVVPIMVRMLPERVIEAIAQAMGLSVLSQELDRMLLAQFPRIDAHFSVDDYCSAYRGAGNLPLRRRQIELIVDIGQALDGYVKKPMIRSALAMMRQPAKLAGLAALHHFLARGFAAFRKMRGADAFLTTIATRETAILEAIAAGDPAPFPDPLDSPGPAETSPAKR